MPKMPVMRAVVEVLKSEGVDVVYGCPGAAILPLYKAMEEDGGIAHLIVRHEEGAAHMADGWSRTTGGVGVAIGTSGPAGTNMITGLYTAHADSVPILCVTGQAAQYDVPFVIVMLNNEYLGLIRMAEDHGGYDMNYQVDLRYDEHGTDNVKIMEAYGCAGRRVLEPGGIRPALEWAREEAARTSRPVLVEIMIEREADTANAVRIDDCREYEPVP